MHREMPKHTNFLAATPSYAARHLLHCLHYSLPHCLLHCLPHCLPHCLLRCLLYRPPSPALANQANLLPPPFLAFSRVFFLYSLFLFSSLHFWHIIQAHTHTHTWHTPSTPPPTPYTHAETVKSFQQQRNLKIVCHN